MSDLHRKDQFEAEIARLRSELAKAEREVSHQVHMVSVFRDAYNKHYKRAEAAESANQVLRAERDRYKTGLQTLATSFYKDDQYQDYAKHVLTERGEAGVTEAMVERAAEAIWRLHLPSNRKNDPWPEGVIGGSQELYRQKALAALEAALGLEGGE